MHALWCQEYSHHQQDYPNYYSRAKVTKKRPKQPPEAPPVGQQDTGNSALSSFAKDARSGYYLK